jgi:hypothetical protein
METVCNRFRQPLMEMVCNRFSNPVKLPKQYVTALGNRLWKRYVTACLVTYPVRQPLMETVLVLPKSLVRRCKTL